MVIFLKIKGLYNESGIKRTGSIDSENLEDSKILSEMKKLTKEKKKN